MVCEHCTKVSKDQFKKEISENSKKSRHDLEYIILNTLYLIVSNEYWYCYCSKEIENKCKLCTFPTILFDFEQDIDKNMFNLSFLKFYHSRLCHDLKQLFDEDQSAIKCFSRQEYEFKVRDWIFGETWSVSLFLSLSL